MCARGRGDRRRPSADVGGLRSLRDCQHGRSYWVADRTMTEEQQAIEIRDACREIQKEWSPRQRTKRAGIYGRQSVWTPPAATVMAEVSTSVPSEPEAFGFFLQCGNDDPMEP